MWILSSDGDFLQGLLAHPLSISRVLIDADYTNHAGKRIWLKPGKKYLFGRVKGDGGKFQQSLGQIGPMLMCS